MADTNKDMVLGSGSVYILKKDTTNATMPDITAIAIADNLAGYIQGGFTLSYKPTYNTDKDDSGIIEKTVMKEEEVKVKFGLVTWNGEFIKKATQTAKIDTATTGKRITEVGGVSNAVMDLYWICFVPDDKDRIEALQVLGLATSGFDLAFGEKASKVETEFDCKPYNEEGRKYKLTETVPEA